MITEGRLDYRAWRAEFVRRAQSWLRYCVLHPVKHRHLRALQPPTERPPRRPLSRARGSSAMFLRAVLLSCAIANAAAFIAPSRAPQWLAPQLAAVLPPRALPTASVTRRGPTALSTFSTEEIEKELARRRQVDKRSDVLQVCPAPPRACARPLPVTLTS